MTLRANAYRDLLTGLLALRHGLIDPARLASAFDIWALDPGRPMAEILSDQGGLDARARARLESLVKDHLKRLGLGLDLSDSAEGGSDALLSATVAYPGSGSGSGPGQSPGPGSGSGSGSTSESGSASGPWPGPGDTPNPDFGPADQGGSRFRVLRPHARGGLGEVFLALDPELNRRVALKELRDYHAHNPASQSRFLLEAWVTGRLEHPGVVPVYGLGRYPDGRPYYATRFIEGETLRAAVARYHAKGGPAPEPGARELAFRRLLRAVIDACNTVAYAHSRGVVHRDLKPENIMLGRFGETLVVDWGLARPVAGPGTAQEPAEWPSLEGIAEESSLTRPGAAVGTPQYMSPEQAAGDHDKVGPASDVYGLGATLYCVLVGHSPFPEGDVTAVLRRVLAGDITPPGQVRTGVDRALEAICLRALALQPEDRHATPLDLAGDLERWLADLRFRVEQEQALNQVKRSLARLCIERAQNLFGRERHGEGLLWLARALESVPADSPELERVVRASLGAWHAGPGKPHPERRLVHGGDVHALAFSADGRRLATACEDCAARLWDVSTGARLTPPLAHAGPVRCLAFSPDGTRVATADLDGTLCTWDALTGRPAGRPAALGAPVLALAYSPDGRWLAAACRSHVLYLRDATSGDPVGDPGMPVEGPDVRVLAIAFSPDGTLLAASGEDGRVVLRDATTGHLRGKALPHPSAVGSLAFSPDGRLLLSGCLDGKARLWDLGLDADAAPAPAAELGHRDKVGAVRFNPSGGSILTACDDGTARLWDVATRAPVGEPLAHKSRVCCLEFAPDGVTLATGSWDGSARLWDANTGLPVGPPLPHKSTVHALAFSPDGRRLATASADGSARCWKVPPPVPGTAARVSCWVRVVTDLDFDAGDAIRPLDRLTGFELRRLLHDLGGPPVR